MNTSPFAVIGQRIRVLRKMQGLTQVVFAEKVNVTQPCVSQWERGVLMPSRATQFVVADALRTTRSMLFRELAEQEVA